MERKQSIGLKELLEIPVNENTEKKVEAFLKQKRKKEERIRKMAKPLQELVVEEEFIIKGIQGYTSGTKITPNSERIYGGRSPIYSAGDNVCIVLQVIPQRKIPIKTLIFNGYAPFRFGETILAKIPKYKEIAIPSRSGHSPTFLASSPSMETLYLDRKFNNQEEAIELSSMNKKEIYRSSNFSSFLKK